MYLENLINKIKLPFQKDKELYRRLYTILGFYPKNISLYKQALIHKSLVVKGKDGRRENNERLEFLGDAILSAIVGDIVYRHFQQKGEGFLTTARSKMVQRDMLGKLAVEMGLDKLIRCNGGQQCPHSFMAGNAFEALIGAIYLDYGYERCMDFVEKRILSRLVNLDKVAYNEVNFKSKLLEWGQKNRIRIDFRDREQRTAGSNSSTFMSDVVVEGITCGTGKGFSKKEANQNAAKEALYNLKKQKGLEQSVFDAKGHRTAMEEQPKALLPDIPEELLKPKKENKPKAEKTKEEKPKAEKAKEEKTKAEKAKEEKPKAEKKSEAKKTKEEPKTEVTPESKPETAENSTEVQETSEPKRKPRRRRRPNHKPSENGGTTPSGNDGTTPSGNGGTTPSGNRDTTPSGDKGTAPSGDKGTAPSRNNSSAPKETAEA